LKLNEKINELNKQRENQDDNIEQLNKKVGYMEIILNALISRKVINHSINKFLSKYKDSLKKTKKQIKKDGKIIEIPYIEVIKDINIITNILFISLKIKDIILII
jgi:hypothetical protein